MKRKRTANKRLLFALLKYKGLTFETLGKRLNPPIKKAYLSRIFDPHDGTKPEKRIVEISNILQVPAEILFPYEGKEILK